MEVVNKGLPAKCCGSGVEERQAIKAGTELRSPTGSDAAAVGLPLLADGSYQLFSFLALFTNNDGCGYEDTLLNRTLRKGGCFQSLAFILGISTSKISLISMCFWHFRDSRLMFSVPGILKLLRFTK